MPPSSLQPQTKHQTIERATYRLAMAVTRYADATAQVEDKRERAIMTGLLDAHRTELHHAIMNLLTVAGLIE